MKMVDGILVDFRPVVEPGWRILVAYFLEPSDQPVPAHERVFAFEVSAYPLAGWAIHKQPQFDEEERLIVRPAYWESGSLTFLGDGITDCDAYGLTNFVKYLIGPGQEPPDEDTMRRDAQLRMGRMQRAEMPGARWMAER